MTEERSQSEGWGIRFMDFFPEEEFSKLLRIHSIGILWVKTNFCCCTFDTGVRPYSRGPGQLAVALGENATLLQNSWVVFDHIDLPSTQTLTENIATFHVPSNF